MKNYKFLPLDGLLSIKQEEISNADILSTLNYLEEKINSIPEGRVTQLALLFYLIKYLNEAGLSFLVKGGIIDQYHLKERARFTYDLDIIIKDDVDIFVKKLEDRLSLIDDTLKFKIVSIKKVPANDNYYYDTFNVEISVFNDNKEPIEVHIDGIVNPSFFEKITGIAYKIPEIIAPDMSFKGAPIEYVMAEKVMAVTNELIRPYKHLVDLYSIIHLNIDVDLLKTCLDMILEHDNKAREKLNKPIARYMYQIKEDKHFIGGYIFTALQAGYNIDLKMMIDEVNKWLEGNL